MFTETEKFIQNLPVIDWRDFDNAASTSQEILNELAQEKNRFILRDLLYFARDNHKLRSMCECHTLDDKIVLYDGLDQKGYRIRFRLSVNEQHERIHNHRFSATHCILRGRYHQKIYTSEGPLNNQSKEEDFKAVWVRDDGPGNSFTIHHDTLHTTTTEEGTVSLLLRGIKEKERAFVLNRESGVVRWKEGKEKESIGRRKSVTMTKSVFDKWCKKLEELEVI